MSEINSDLCCPICLNVFSEKENIPYILKCGHTLCKKCLIVIMKSDSEKCGECRAVIHQKNINKLPINYALLRLAEVAKSKSNATISDDFNSLDEKISNMIEKLSENQEIYKDRARDTLSKVSELEQEKQALKKIKSSLVKTSLDLKNSRNLEESFEMIKKTMDKIKDIDKQSALINKRMQQGRQYGEFQLVMESPSSYMIKYNEDLGSVCFSQHRRVYMKSVRPKPCIKRSMTINLEVLQPFLFGVYMIIEYDGHQSLLEFKTMKDQLSKIFLQNCLEESSPFCGFLFFNQQRAGLEGESVSVGTKSLITEETKIGVTLNTNADTKKSDDSSKRNHSKEIVKKGKNKANNSSNSNVNNSDSIAINKDLKRNDSIGRKRGGGAGGGGIGNKLYIKKGYVEVVGRPSQNRIDCFNIYLEGWPRVFSSQICAQLVRGESFLKAALKNKCDIKITETGQIFDFSCKKN